MWTFWMLNKRSWTWRSIDGCLSRAKISENWQIWLNSRRSEELSIIDLLDLRYGVTSMWFTRWDYLTMKKLKNWINMQIPNRISINWCLVLLAYKAISTSVNFWTKMHQALQIYKSHKVGMKNMCITWLECHLMAQFF